MAQIVNISFAVEITDEDVQLGRDGIRDAARRFCDDLASAARRPYVEDGPIGDAVLRAFADESGLGSEIFYGTPASDWPSTTVTVF